MYLSREKCIQCLHPEKAKYETEETFLSSPLITLKKKDLYL